VCALLPMWPRRRLASVKSVRHLSIEIEQEDDGRWIAEVTDLPGVVAYGDSRRDAISHAEALAFRVLAERLESGEPVPEIDELFAVAK